MSSRLRGGYGCGLSGGCCSCRLHTLKRKRERESKREREQKRESKRERAKEREREREQEVTLQ